MRLNQYIAHSTGISRRAADKAISEGKVAINGQLAVQGIIVQGADRVTLDGRAITPHVKTITILLNKPLGYVCSREGQGSKTVYDLLPKELHHLKPAGRLDKDSSGLLLLTNDGNLANQLTHPKYQKTKVYEVRLNRSLKSEDLQKLQQGVVLEDGVSKLNVQQLEIGNQELVNNERVTPNCYFQITMSEGRNRQIRRTFDALGYKITRLHRITFGNYTLEPPAVSSSLQLGDYIVI